MPVATPKAPDHITYKELWASVLTTFAVRVPDVPAFSRFEEEGDRCCSRLGDRQARAQDHYRTQRPLRINLRPVADSRRRRELHEITRRWFSSVVGSRPCISGATTDRAMCRFPRDPRRSAQNFGSASEHS